MRILLTGVSGQIGGTLRAPLQTLGNVIGADRKQIDLSRSALLSDTLDTMKPDLIVNPAAYTAVDRAETESELAFLINATAPGILARWAAKNAVPIVHFSTDYVFDGSGDRPWCEDDVTSPLSVYGRSKLAGENAVRLAGGTHLIIRTSWIYAASGNNFLQRIIRRATEGGELQVVNDQFGAPTSITSIAEIFPHFVAGDKASIASRFDRLDGIVHIANSGSTSWHGFATAILDGLSKRGIAFAGKIIAPISSIDVPTAAKRPRNSRLDLARLENTLGLKMPDWQTALSDQLDLVKSPAQSSVH